MLELKNIKKDYIVGDSTVTALKGIDLKFRESEFVAILGPSGCGKTTMLNIVGGLDQYTEGDLVINGRSTKDFSDRDWDTYRNNSVGFVFQSYNLIPHQTVLQNVELALTLSGVSKEERKKRAKQVLEDVGLGDQFNKKPTEMSGGQMQRVAIARALVNNPDIILADEPTGALDTKTSVQVMEILKEVSKERLVVMVTHNPILAEKYSTRIIKMLDGEITDDSVPVEEEEEKEFVEKTKIRIEHNKKAKKTKKSSMSLLTAFSLSLKNLMTKRGRTVLTAFAGSIGIIGIALILALSQGFMAYIDFVQENTLASYPLTIESSVTDLGSLIEVIMGTGEKEIDHELDGVYPNPIMHDLVNSLGSMETSENDLKSFKKFIEEKNANKNDDSGLADAINGIKYTYDFDLLTYTKEKDGTIIRSDPTELLSGLLKESMGMDFPMLAGGEGMGSSPMSSMGSMFSTGFSSNVWEEMLSGEDGKLVNGLLDTQYDLLYGSWPNSYDEVILVVDENNELSDLTLYALGLESTENMNKILEAAMNGETLELAGNDWSYEEICNMNFKVVLNANRFSLDRSSGKYIDLIESEAGMNYLYDNGINIKVSGIIRPNKDAMATMISGSIGYTYKLTEHIIEQSNSTDAIKAQLKDESLDIFTGLPFKTDDMELNNEEKDVAFREYVTTLSAKEKAELYLLIKSTPTDEYLTSSIEQLIGGMTRKDIEALMSESLEGQPGMDVDKIKKYIDSMDDETLMGYVKTAMKENVAKQYSQGVKEQMGGLTTEQLIAAFDGELASYTVLQTASFYDNLIPDTYSEATLKENLKALGYVDIESPSSINLFATTFESKDTITAAISKYNESVKDIEKITYTDFVGLMMSSMTTIINTISYVLIAFVSISLIVSSIMIGVITLISVQERTKEIGILRAVGASKKDVSNVFNAETVIIGLAAGLLGIVVTVILCIPINIIIHKITGIMNLNAFLPWQAAIILVLISVVLTLISGIIPARSASKKDPVVALRSE